MISLRHRNNSKNSKNNSLTYSTVLFAQSARIMQNHSFDGTFPDVPGFTGMRQVAKQLHALFPEPKQRYPSQTRWARRRSMSTSKIRSTKFDYQTFHCQRSEVCHGSNLIIEWLQHLIYGLKVQQCSMIEFGLRRSIRIIRTGPCRPKGIKAKPCWCRKETGTPTSGSIELIRIAWGQIKQNQISKRDVESKTIDSTRVARGFHRETQEDAWCRHLGLEAPNHRHRRSEAWYIARPGCSIYLAGRWIMDICFVHKDFESGIYRDTPLIIGQMREGACRSYPKYSKHICPSKPIIPIRW